MNVVIYMEQLRELLTPPVETNDDDRLEHEDNDDITKFNAYMAEEYLQDKRLVIHYREVSLIH